LRRREFELAGLYAAQKEEQKAVDEYIEAIREDPKADIPHYRLGQIYRQMNKLDLATAEWRGIRSYRGCMRRDKAEPERDSAVWCWRRRAKRNN